MNKRNRRNQNSNNKIRNGDNRINRNRNRDNRTSNLRVNQQIRSRIGQNNARNAARNRPDDPISPATDANTVSRLTTRNVGFIRPDSVTFWRREHITALGSKLSNLTAATFRSLHVDAIRELSQEQLEGLTKGKIQLMTSAQFANIPNIGHLSDVGFSYLNPGIHIANLTPDQAGQIRPEQTAKMKAIQLEVLSPNALARMTPESLAAITPAIFSKIDDDQIKALQPEQIAAITPEQIAKLSDDQLSELSSEQLAELQPESFAAISKEAIKGLSKEKLEVIKAEHINVMTLDQVEGIIEIISPETSKADIQAFLKLEEGGTPAELFQLLKGIGLDRILAISEITALVKASAGITNKDHILQILNSIGNRSSISETTTLISNASRASLMDIDAMIQAAPAEGNPAVELTNLLGSVSSQTSIPEITTLIQEVRANDANATIQGINELIESIPQKHLRHANNFTGLIQAIGNRGSLAKTTELINRIGVNNSLIDMTNLVTAAVTLENTITLERLANFIELTPKSNTRASDLEALIQATGAQGTIDDLKFLVRDAITYGTIPNITDLVRSIGVKNTISEITRELLREVFNSRILGDRATIGAITALINADLTEANPATAFKELINKVGNRSPIGDVIAFVRRVKQIHPAATITEINTLLEEVNRHNPNTTIAEVNALFRATPAGGNPLTDLTTILNRIGNRSTIAETITLLQRINVHNAGTAVADIDALIQTVPNGVNASTRLTTLVNRVGGRSTIVETTTLLQRINVHRAGTSTTHIDDLLQTVAGDAANPATELTTIVNGVGDRSSIAETTTLLARINVHRAGTNNADIVALINAAPAGGNPSARLTTLINRVGDRSSIAHTTTLIQRAIHHNATTTLAEIDALVNAAGNQANIAQDLTDVINEVANNANVPETTLMIQRATIRIGPGNTNELVALIHQGPVQNTPARVRALLNALAGVNVGQRLAKFQRIRPRIALFEQRAANGGIVAVPAYGTRRYDATGNVTLAPPPSPNYASQHSWDHFYRRHSYRHFDFNDIKLNNSMWPDGTNLRNMLDAELPGAVVAGFFNTAPPYGPPFYTANTANVQIGVNGTNRLTQLYPTGGADEDFSDNELNAINNLL